MSNEPCEPRGSRLCSRPGLGLLSGLEPAKERPGTWLHLEDCVHPDSTVAGLTWKDVTGYG